MEAELREELLQIIEPTRAESGCVSMRIFALLRELRVFAGFQGWIVGASEKFAINERYGFSSFAARRATLSITRIGVPST